MKTFLLGCLLLLTVQISIAQKKLPALDFAPQSPTASAYSRYGEIPVDHSTGVPKIEIPIYTVTVGDVSIPITISYHASGIKVRDAASGLGLGFVLNTGPVLTSTTVGLPDYQNSKCRYFKSSNDINNNILKAQNEGAKALYDLSWSYWNFLIMNPEMTDYYSDRYYYSLCTGESGIFRKDFISDSIRFIPYRPIQVEMRLPNITITSSNGYKHYFQGYTDSHNITKIVSENKRDSIMYHTSQYLTDYFSQMNVGYGVSWANGFVQIDDMSSCALRYVENQPVNETFRTGGTDTYSTQLLDRLETKNEIISFYYQ